MRDWLPQEQFDRTEYGRLNKQPGAMNYVGRTPFPTPPGGRVVPDPKDGNFGIVVDRDGTALAKIDLKPPTPLR
jgi:hypothetical protein